MVIKNKQFVVRAGVYRQDVLFIIGMSDAQFKKTASTYQYRNESVDLVLGDDSMYKVGDGHTNGIMLPMRSGSSIIRIPPYDDTDLIHRAVVIHEVVHATAHMLRKAGLPLTKSSEEAYTYLMEHIMIGFYHNTGVAK